MAIGITASQLKMAGFDDESIIGYIEDQRPSLLHAGFSDHQIDKFYGLTRTTPLLSDLDTNPLKNEGFNQNQEVAPDKKQIETLTGQNDKSLLAEEKTANDAPVVEPSPDYNSLYYANVQKRIDREKEMAAAEKETMDKGILPYYMLTDAEKQEVDVQLPPTVGGGYMTDSVTRDGKEFTVDRSKTESPFGKMQEGQIKVLNTLATTGPNSKIVLDSFQKATGLENDDIATFNEFVSFISALESDNRNIENEMATKGGVFQIHNDEMITLLNQFANIARAQNPEFKPPIWWEKAFVHRNAEKLPIDAQRALAIIKLTTNPDLQALLIKGSQGDLDALTTLYKEGYNPDTLGTRDVKAFDERVTNYMGKFTDPMGYRYQLPQLATWDEDGWLTTYMKETYGGRKFINYTGGAGDQNIFSNGYLLSTMGLIEAYHNAVTINGQDPVKAYEEIFMHQAQSFPQEIIQSAITLFADMPAIVTGAGIGFGEGTLLTTATGGTAAPAVPYIVAANAFGLPETVRDVYMRAMMNGKVNNFEELLEEIFKAQTAKTYAKYSLVGASTYGAGSLTTKLGGGTVLRIGSEVTTMVTLSSVLEGRVPTRGDFAHAAVLIFGIHGAARGINKLHSIYKQYGVHPRDMETLAQKRDDVKMDLLDPDVEIPAVFKELNEQFIQGLEAEAGIKLVPSPKFNQGDTVHLSESGTSKGKVLKREETESGEVILQVEKPSGEIVYIKEAEAHIVAPENIETVEVGKDGKITIKDKPETNFKERQENGEFNSDVVELQIPKEEIRLKFDKDLKKPNEDVTKNPKNEVAAEVLEISGKDAKTEYSANGLIFNDKLIFNTNSFGPKLQNAKAQLGEGAKLVKIKDMYKSNMNNWLKKHVPNLKDKGSRVDVVYEINRGGPTGAKLDSYVLRNNKGEFFTIPKRLYEAIQQTQGWSAKTGGATKGVNTDLALIDNVLVVMAKAKEISMKEEWTTRKIVAAIKLDKIKGQGETQAKSYYDNHIPKDGKVFHDRFRSSKGGEKWEVPDEPSDFVGPLQDLPRLEGQYKNFFNNNKGLDTFDLVELVRVLIDKTPVVKRMPAELRGYFQFKEGLKPEEYQKVLTVAVNKALSENPKSFTMTLAHEIGHLIDFLPEGTMKKGNILGSMVAMKGYLNKWVDGKADGAKPLDPKEIAKLKKEAEAEAAKNEPKIDKEIETDLKITPKKILDIFRDPEIRSKIDPEFYTAFAKLDGKLKKQITKSAMRGMIDPHIKALVDRINGKTPRGKANQKLSEEAMEIFKRKFETEIRERGLVSREEIFKELQALSQKWKPFDRAYDPKYTKYRDNPRELMADFMMAFLLRPKWTMLNAPKSWQLFNYHMYKRPEVKAQYEKLQNLMNKGTDARYSDMINKISDQFVDSKISLYESVENAWQPNSKDPVHIDLFDNFGWLYRRFGGPSGMWGKNKSGNSRWMDKDTLNLNARIESYRYRNSGMTRYTELVDAKVFRPVEEAGYNSSMLSTFLLLKNLAVSEQRMGLANPFGLWSQLKKIGPEGEKIANEFVGERTPTGAYEYMAKQHPILEEAANNFYKLRAEFVLPLIKESKAFDKKTLEKIENNEEYINFNVLKYAKERLENSGGKNISSASFSKASEGTLGDIVDPLLATWQKDMITMAEMKRNRLIHDTVKWMIRNKSWLEKFDAEYMGRKTNGQWKDKVIQKAKYKDKGVVEKAPVGMETIGFMQNGKFVYYHINKFAAHGFKRNPYTYMTGIRLMQSSNNFFRTIFTEYNPLFWGKNMFRDINRAVRNLEGARYFDLAGAGKNAYMKYLMKAIKPAWAMSMGKRKGTDLTTMMEKEGFVISMMDGYHGKAGEAALKRMLENKEITQDAYVIELFMQRLSPKEYQTFYDKTFGRIFQSVSDFAKFLERTHKVAGTMYLKDMIERGEISMSTQEMMLKVQADVGSPSFLRTGRLHPLMNNLFIFSNAMKEGVRGDYVRLREDPLGVTGKFIAYNTVPKLAQKAMKYGLFGTALATFFAGVSEYDEQNYIVIPLAYTKSGRPVYFRIPQDESARVMNGFMGLAIDAAFGDGEVGIQNFMKALKSDVTLSANPAIPFILDAVDFMQGGNPKDSFKGEYALNEDVWKAQDHRTAKEALKYMWNSYGGSSIYRLKGETQEEVADELMTLFPVLADIDVSDMDIDVGTTLEGTPVFGTFMNTFIKIGEHPVKANIYKDFEVIERDKSRESLTFKEAVKKMVTNEPLSRQEMEVVAKRADYIKNNPFLKKAIVQSTTATDLVQMLATETDTRKKLDIMKRLQEFVQQNPEDFPLLFKAE